MKEALIHMGNDCIVCIVIGDTRYINANFHLTEKEPATAITSSNVTDAVTIKNNNIIACQ